ncbi:MAG: hypothetical protein C0483_21485 [Pirellula sp.]|nr:hypothetical protein [Pirellula sp.]
MTKSAPAAEYEALDDDDLLDAVVEEFTAICRTGATPQPSEFAARHPRIAEQLIELLPTIAAIEQTKSSSDPTVVHGFRGNAPERLGDYRIVREIGRGGMGVVYEAVQESLGRTVALKVLPQQMLADAKRVERFEQEARIAARLHHTNIVPVFGVGFDEGLHYYVMQRIHGEGWDRRLLHSATKPTAQEAARIGRDAARALQQAHDEGTLHRDVKPGNILIDDQQHVWLTDFGLAQILESDVTATAHVAGTLRYLPPERLHGVSDARGDVYSLGVALFEAVGGRPPFEARSNVELMRLIAHGEPARLRKIDPAIPRDFETIVTKATAREPNDRYVSAAAMADDLERFLQGMPIRAREFGTAERAWRWCRRNRTTATALAAAVLALVLLAAVSTVGYWRTTRLNDDLAEAFVREQASRRSAESTSRTALEALDTVFERFAPRGSWSLGASAISTEATEDLDGALSAGDVARTVTNVTPQTAAALEELLPFYLRLAAERGDDPQIRRQAASAMHRIGLIQAKVGRFEEARSVWTREAALLAELAKEQPSAAGEFALAAAVLDADLGDLERVQDRIPDAKAAYERALEKLEKMDAAQHSFEMRRELARVHLALAQRMHHAEHEHLGPQGPRGREEGHGPPGFDGPPGFGGPLGFDGPPGLGDSNRPPPPPRGLGGPGGPPHERHPFGPPGFDRRPMDGPPGEGPPHDDGLSPDARPPEHAKPPRDDPAELAAHLNAAFSLLEALHKERPNDRLTRLLLARSYRERAKAADASVFHLETADFAESAKLLRALCDESPDLPDYAHELSIALSDFNPRRLPPEKRDVASKFLYEALAISERLTQQFPETTLYVGEQPHILHRIATMQADDHDREAEAVYRRGVKVCAELTKRFPKDFVYAYWETRMRQSLAEFLAGAPGRKSEALAEAERAAALIRPYAEEKNGPPPALPLDDQLRHFVEELKRRP